MEVIFFGNGNNVALEGSYHKGKQVPHLQKSWLMLYVEFLESQGVDPTKVKYSLPVGKEAEVFKTPDGYNWRIL